MTSSSSSNTETVTTTIAPSAAAPKPIDNVVEPKPVSKDTLNMPSAAAPRPTSVNAAELATSYKWDACVENSLVKTGYGLVGAGLLSLLLFRSPAARAAVTGIGAGFGAGMSWVECKQTFATNSPIRPTLSRLQLPTIPQSQQSTQDRKQ